MAVVSESERVWSLLQGVKKALPPSPRVVDWSLRFFEDASGDPAVSVTAILDESTRDADWTSENLDPIADQVRSAIRDSGINRWPYVRFARPSDMKAAG